MSASLLELLEIAGLVSSALALVLVPAVLSRRKEPSSSIAWLLALVFLPFVGAALFLLFGRDRVRLPARRKRASDRLVPPPAPPRALEEVLSGIKDPVVRELFRVSAALAGAQPSAGNEVDLLVDGPETYRALGEAIDGARERVHAAYYLIRRGRTADWFRERLVAAARRGVAVRLLVDGYGSFWLGRRWFAPLLAAGGEVSVFLPARLMLLQPMNLRNHRKIVVVDGEVAFTGGINIDDAYVEGASPWRDTHVRLRGPSARDLDTVFAQDWSFAARRELELRAPGTPVRGGAGAIVSVLRSGPDTHHEPIHRVFFTAIARARRSVRVTTPYFVPDRALVVALQTAALRGVRVDLVLPAVSNHKVVFHAGRSFYEELLEAGVRIHEYAPGMIHAKTLVVDGVVGLVGSANMDLRSFRLNFEVHAVVHDEATCRALEATFEADLARSTPVALASWRARSRAQRVVEGAARLVSPIL